MAPPPSNAAPPRLHVAPQRAALLGPLDEVRVATAQNVRVDLRLGTLGARVLAAVVDTFVQIGLLVAASLVERVEVVVAAMALAGLYPLLAESLFDGRTVGKHLLRLRVARLDGEPPTLAQYALRALLRPFDVLLGLGLVAMLLSRHTQRLGDLAAGTVVLRDGDRVTLEETLYRAAEREAAVTFPGVETLTERELDAVRRIAAALRAAPGDAPVYAMAEQVKARVEARLGVATAMPPAVFVEAILHDHNVLTGRL